MISDIKIRYPIVAGAFYPASKEILEGEIRNFLKKAEEIKTKGELKILIVPHAGYNYSGLVAAYGFKKLENNNYQKIILIGPSHSDYFSGFSVYNQGSWLTPLGEIEIDEELANNLIKENKKIFFREQSHLEEHCLEVELPFLQIVLKNFKIIPIIIGEIEKKDLEILAEAIYKNLDEKTLVLISSDLSHYPPYKVANYSDKKIIKAILSGEVENLEKTIKEIEKENLENLHTSACGEKAIKVALILAKKLKIKEIKLLKYLNSGDITRDYSQVVGYASIAFLK